MKNFFCVLFAVLFCSVGRADMLSGAFFAQDETLPTIENVYWLRYQIYADDTRLEIAGSPIALQFDATTFDVDYNGIVQTLPLSPFHEYYTLELVNYWNSTDFRLFTNNNFGHTALQFATNVNRLTNVTMTFEGQANGTYSGQSLTFDPGTPVHMPEPTSALLTGLATLFCLRRR